MMTVIAAAALAAQAPATPAAADPMAQHAQHAQQGQPADKMAMDCCKECCKDMAKHDGQRAEHPAVVLAHRQRRLGDRFADHRGEPVPGLDSSWRFKL